MSAFSISAKTKWLSVKNHFNSESPTEILIQGPIGETWYDDSGTSERAFTAALDEIPKDKPIVVGINSEGGSVKDGLGIYHALLRRGKTVTTRIDGYAVSIASVIALAGERRVSPESSIWMIHEPWAMAVGDAEAMRKEAAALDAHAEAIVAIYTERTGLKAEDARAKMKAETWFRGGEAKDMGFATETSADSPALNAIDFTKYANVPKDILQILAAPKGAKPTIPPRSEPGQSQPPITDAADFPPAEEKRGDGTPEPKSAKQTNKETTMADQPTSVAAPQTPAKDDMSELKNLIVDLQTKVAAINSPPIPIKPTIEVGDSVARKAINEKAAGKARFDFLRDNWQQLSNAGIPVVRNANTTDSALTTDMLASGLIVVLQNRLPSLAAFTRDFGTDRLKPKATVQVPIVMSGGTAQTNATSFEDTTNFVGTIDNVAITVNRITSGAHITPAELNSGFRMAQFAEIKAAELADAIQQAVNAVITTANFTSTPITSAAATFTIDDLNSAWETIAKGRIKNVMLHQSYFKKFLPTNLESFNPLATNTLPGWDGFYLNTLWTGATAKTYGFACSPGAIAIASGLPLSSPNRGGIVSAQTITLPGINLSVEQQEWFSPSSKTDWMNWEVMLGAAKGDGTAGVLIMAP